MPPPRARAPRAGRGRIRGRPPVRALARREGDARHPVPRLPVAERPRRGSALSASRSAGRRASGASIPPRSTAPTGGGRSRRRFARPSAAPSRRTRRCRLASSSGCGLSQVAGCICTMELTALEHAGKASTATDEKLFGSWSQLPFPQFKNLFRLNRMKPFLADENAQGGIICGA